MNGTGIARDAAGRGLSVLLLEQGDLACGTSSASTKLIHGGLRYLEHYAFRLVRESLAEREVLLRAAPHIIRPLRFVLPHHAGLRPRWLIRLGLFLYDHLGGRRILPPTRVLDLHRDPAGAPLRPEYARGFEYSDCWVDDARLVVLTARDAAARGADIRTRTRCIGARRTDGVWRLTLEGGAEAGARVLVNAAGPHVSRVLADVVGVAGTRRVRLVKGSHIVVPRLYAHDRCYIFQNGDGRVCFAIPYRGRFHPDRHHRRGFSRRSGRSGQHAGRGGVSVRRGQRLSAPAGRSDRISCGATRACVRCWTTASARRRTRRGTTCWNWMRLPANRPSCRCSAASSRRIDGWPKPRWRSWRRSFPGMRGDWTAQAALPGGDFPWDAIGARGGRPASALSVPVRGHVATAGAGIRHAGGRHAGRRTRRRRSRPVLRCRSDRAGGGLAEPYRMGLHRRRCAVAAEQAGIADRVRRRLPRWTNIWRSRHRYSAAMLAQQVIALQTELHRPKPL